MKKLATNLHTVSILLVFFLLNLAIFVSCNRPASVPDDWEQAEAILQQIEPPSFPDRSFSITDFGAVGDGVTDNTANFEKAIAACHNAGGGRIVVPAGNYLTGAIHLKSNVNLVIRENATVRFSQDYNDYLPVVHTRFEGVECMNYSPLIYAYGQRHIGRTGGCQHLVGLGQKTGSRLGTGHAGSKAGSRFAISNGRR